MYSGISKIPTYPGEKPSEPCDNDDEPTGHEEEEKDVSEFPHLKTPFQVTSGTRRSLIWYSAHSPLLRNVARPVPEAVQRCLTRAL